MKNVISRKLQTFEQSNLAEKLAIPESTLTEPHYRDMVISSFVKIFISKFSEKNLKKSKKKRHISKTTRI